MKKILRSLSLMGLVAFTGALIAQTPPLPPKPAVPPKPLPTTPQTPIPPAPQPNAAAWVLMDYANGQILAEHDMDARRAPASLTKVMTEYVVNAELAAGKIHMNDQVHISEHAWRAGGAGTDGSTSFLKLNSEVQLKDLLYGMIIQSGNDAAIALAEHVAGSEQAFSDMMNTYAQRLGMTGTHFVNASGYPAPDHYSTAHDIAILSRALIRNFPEQYKISAIKSFEWNGITQHNRNTLLWTDPSVDGIKTGSTKEAGFCLAASALRNGMRLIAVTLGGPDMNAAATGDEALLNWGFNFYRTHTLYAAGQALATPRLWKGATNTLELGIAEDASVTIPRGRYDQLQATLEIPQRLVAPFTKGQRVGTLNVTFDGKPLVSEPLVVLQDAPQGGFFKRLWDAILLLFHRGNGTTTTPAPTVTVSSSSSVAPPAASQ
ncbi:MAG: D-alanyl-D-alanine carboxypeptidase [Xanthomonadales bacterium]|nr:D-alanyl-D-alanine carboxypeptidase [Xanthomonadales bacterium]ODU92078.1 MAG: serine-type D-Ala-D-Ala carboxypeptidase [Rhodanobacter sp. SCN 66-43]OJY86058.1 MAG: serine-type D-Ala-D-Ala carboxypeptidase [Xanthomonadales bacterium 66-474]